MKDLWAKAKKLSFLSLPLCFCSLVCFDATLRLIYRFVGDTRFLAWQPWVFTLCWSLALTGLVSLLPRLGRRVAMGVLGAFFALLTLAHGALYNIFGHFFTFSDLNFAGDGAKFFSWAYLNFRTLFLLLLGLGLALMALAIALAAKPRQGAPRWRRPVLALAALLVGAAGIAATHFSLLPEEKGMTWEDNYDPSDVRAAYGQFSDPNRCMMITGLYQYTFRDLGVALGIGSEVATVSDLDSYYEQRAQEISGENELTGALEGKNLIMVMLESMDTWLATPEIMPNLCALRDQSVDFVNFYTPLFLSAGTFNTEITSQTGLLPANTGMPTAAYSTNSFPLSLAHLFREEGYTANSFHAASPGIYSRGSIHQNLGFEAYHSYVDMGMDDYMLDSQMLRAYDQMAPDGSFFSYVITYSGHGPYNESLSNISDPHLQAAQEVAAASGVTGSPENLEEYTLAIAHAMETDAFIGGLVEQLEADGKLEDTVLLVYADHYGKYITDTEFLLQLKGVSSGDPDLYRTPCFLYSADLPAQKVEKYVSTVDLAPTLVNLFDLPADRRYYTGDDIFGDKGGYVLLPHGGWLDGEEYYSPGYTADPTQEALDRSAQCLERITMSMDTLRRDYFRHWTY